MLAAVFNDAFYRALLLLVATAALTGFLVPVIKSYLDDRKFRDQKVFEAELARQSKVIESQAKLLDDLSRLLWGFLLLSLAVTFYAKHGNHKKFEVAWQTYDEKNWEYFGNIRAAISAARRLTPPTTHKALMAVYDDWFMDFDTSLTNAYKQRLRPGSNGWSALHDRIYAEGVPRIDLALTGLAEELKLAGSKAESMDMTEGAEFNEPNGRKTSLPTRA